MIRSHASVQLEKITKIEQELLALKLTVKPLLMYCMQQFTEWAIIFYRNVIITFDEMEKPFPSAFQLECSEDFLKRCYEHVTYNRHLVAQFSSDNQDLQRLQTQIGLLMTVDQFTYNIFSLMTNKKILLADKKTNLKEFV